MQYSMTESAIGLHEFFTSLIAAGFTESQAMQIVCAAIQSRNGDEA